MNQLVCQLGQIFVFPVREAPLYCEVLPFGVTKFAHSLNEGIVIGIGICPSGTRTSREETDAPHSLRALGAGAEREPSEGRNQYECTAAIQSFLPRKIGSDNYTLALLSVRFGSKADISAEAESQVP